MTHNHVCECDSSCAMSDAETKALFGRMVTEINTCPCPFVLMSTFQAAVLTTCLMMADGDTASAAKILEIHIQQLRRQFPEFLRLRREFEAQFHDTPGNA